MSEVKMAELLNILVIEDRHADFMMVERHLKQSSLSASCSRVDTLPALNEAIAQGNWHLVLADYNVPRLIFQETLNLLLTELPEVPIIMVTGSLGEEKAVELLKMGVCDFVLKGNLARLVPAIERSLKDTAELRAKRETEEELRQAHKMEAVGLLAGGVAHDFNNILSAIYGYSHLILSQSVDNEPVKKYVDEIIKASERAAALTRSLLALSRKQLVTLAVIDLNEVIKGNEAFLNRLIREDIELKITCTSESLTVLADRGQIEQVIMNLVANARDAMPNGGKLNIETVSATIDQAFIDNHGYGKAGAYSSFSVSDSGFGMDNDTQSHIFEPFFTTKEQGKGTGLGLSMCYGIIKKHDGFIIVNSEPGAGTIFTAYLPTVKAAVKVENLERRGALIIHGRNETILLCEDDAGLLKLTTELLNHYGYYVIEAVDGQDGVDKFIEFGDSIDLVIMDLIMPRMNGREAGKKMRAGHPDLKVIFVSGYAGDIYIEGNMLNEKTMFIQKPVLPDELVTKIRNLLDKK